MLGSGLSEADQWILRNLEAYTQPLRGSQMQSRGSEAAMGERTYKVSQSQLEDSHSKCPD